MKRWLALVLVGLAACSAASDPVAEPVPDATEPARVLGSRFGSPEILDIGQVRACTLLSSAEVASATGAEVTAAVEGTAPDGAAMCTWSDGGEIDVLVLTVDVADAYTPGAFASPEDVADEGQWIPDGDRGELRAVLAGRDRSFVIEVISGTADPREAARRLGLLLLPRL